MRSFSMNHPRSNFLPVLENWPIKSAAARRSTARLGHCVTPDAACFEDDYWYLSTNGWTCWGNLQGPAPCCGLEECQCSLRRILKWGTSQKGVRTENRSDDRQISQMKFSRITQRNTIANKLARWFRLGEVKKDLKVSVYFKLDRAVFQKNKDINHRIIHAARKLRKAPLQLPLKAGTAVKWDQISQGFILSCLENLKDRLCEQPVPLLSCPYGEKVPHGVQSSFFSFSTQSHVFSSQPWLFRLCSEGNCFRSQPSRWIYSSLNLLLPYEKPQVFNKSRCCIPECSQSSGESLPY